MENNSKDYLGSVLHDAARNGGSVMVDLEYDPRKNHVWELEREGLVKIFLPDSSPWSADFETQIMLTNKGRSIFGLAPELRSAGWTIKFVLNFLSGLFHK